MANSRPSAVYPGVSLLSPAMADAQMTGNRAPGGRDGAASGETSVLRLHRDQSAVIVFRKRRPQQHREPVADAYPVHRPVQRISVAENQLSFFVEGVAVHPSVFRAGKDIDIL